MIETEYAIEFVRKDGTSYKVRQWLDGFGPRDGEYTKTVSLPIARRYYTKKEALNMMRQMCGNNAGMTRLKRLEIQTHIVDEGGI